MRAVSRILTGRERSLTGDAGEELGVFVALAAPGLDEFEAAGRLAGDPCEGSEGGARRPSTATKQPSGAELGDGPLCRLTLDSKRSRDRARGLEALGANGPQNVTERDHAPSLPRPHRAAHAVPSKAPDGPSTPPPALLSVACSGTRATLRAPCTHQENRNESE